MVELSLYQALTIYAWFPLAFTLGTLLLIARFYERFSAAHTHCRLYTLPILGYAAAYVREAALAYHHDSFADAMQTISGLMVLLLVARLSLLMLRPHEAPASFSPPLLVVGGLFGPAGLTFALYMLGRFTQRMVRLNRQPPYFRAYYLAALGMAIATLFRFILDDANTSLALVYPSLVAASATTGAITSWRAWSWLLAERA